LVFCSGKIYYEILEEKEKTNSGDNIAVVRLEQIYPLPDKQMDKVLEKYSNAKKHLWVQEEPKNMGAWSFLALNYETTRLECISRLASASPASGSPVTSAARQQAILDSVFSHAKQTVK
jgi:2-oxoglutarate dehydrogenase E1 component